MAKLPFYIEAENLKKNNKHQLVMDIKIKRIGIPILVFKALKEFNIKCYEWIYYYPYFCLKMILK